MKASKISFSCSCAAPAVEQTATVLHQSHLEKRNAQARLMPHNATRCFQSTFPADAAVLTTEHRVALATRLRLLVLLLLIYLFVQQPAVAAFPVYNSALARRRLSQSPSSAEQSRHRRPAPAAAAAGAVVAAARANQRELPAPPLPGRVANLFERQPLYYAKQNAAPETAGGAAELLLAAEHAAPSTTTTAIPCNTGTCPQSFMLALLAGTVRRLSFERCDRHTQRVTITANPGDTVIVKCPGAGRTIPVDVTAQCCPGVVSNCTTANSVNYSTLFRSSLEGFKFASGDGTKTAWKLKIPESLQAPFPTFNVTWLGPTALDIPIIQGPPSDGIPTTTVVIRVEALPRTEDRIATYSGSETTDNDPRVRMPVDDEASDWLEFNKLTEVGGVYERTRFGLRRISAAAAPQNKLVACASNSLALKQLGRIDNMLFLVSQMAAVVMCVPLTASVSVGIMIMWS